MDRTRRYHHFFPILVAAGLLIAGLPGSVQGQESRAGGLAVRLEPAKVRPGGVQPDRPILLGAALEVDVYGAVAVATLIQEFENPNGETARFRHVAHSFEVPLAEQIEVQGEEADASQRVRAAFDDRSGNSSRAGRQQESEKQWYDAIGKERSRLLAEVTAIQPVPEEEPEPVAPLTQADGRVLRSAPFDLEPEVATTVRSQFPVRLSSVGREFGLTLPAIGDADPEGVAGRADHGFDDLPLGITVTVHHPEPLWIVTSPTHEIATEYGGDRTVIRVLGQAPATRPFELKFEVNTEKEPTLVSRVTRLSAAPSPPDRRDLRYAVEALVRPPEHLERGERRPKQVIFIMDSSGSMEAEEKIDQARDAVAWCIERLDENDRFNVIEFDTEFTLMSEEPVSPQQMDVATAREWLARVQASGGTSLLPALTAGFAQPEDPERHRMFVVITDGYLSDETEALSLLEEELGEGRLFVVGTGKQAHHQTLLRLAEYGRGAATFVGERGALGEAVAELYRAIEGPIGWDVEVDWAGADIEEMLPSRLPDLYEGRAVRVLAWVRGDLPSTLRVKLSATDGTHIYDVALPPRLP